MGEESDRLAALLDIITPSNPGKPAPWTPLQEDQEDAYAPEPAKDRHRSAASANEALLDGLDPAMRAAVEEGLTMAGHPAVQAGGRAGIDETGEKRTMTDPEAALKRPAELALLDGLVSRPANVERTLEP